MVPSVGIEPTRTRRSFQLPKLVRLPIPARGHKRTLGPAKGEQSSNGASLFLFRLKPATIFGLLYGGDEEIEVRFKNERI